MFIVSFQFFLVIGSIWVSLISSIEDLLNLNCILKHTTKDTLSIVYINYLHNFLFFIDILRGIKEVQEELYSSLYRHQLVLPVQSVESNEEGLHLSFHQSVLRLHCHGDNFAQLRLPSHG